jgi:hypothetical protein
MHVIAPAVDREDPEDLAGRIRQTKAVWFPAGMAFGYFTCSPLFAACPALSQGLDGQVAVSRPEKRCSAAACG